MRTENRGRPLGCSNSKRFSLKDLRILPAFATRTDLLIPATRYRGDTLGVEDRLAPSRPAKTGAERLRLYIGFQGNFIPEFCSVAKALMKAQAESQFRIPRKPGRINRVVS